LSIFKEEWGVQLEDEFHPHTEESGYAKKGDGQISHADPTKL
jgi:hypothetical protein